LITVFWLELPFFEVLCLVKETRNKEKVKTACRREQAVLFLWLSFNSNFFPYL